MKNLIKEIIKETIKLTYVSIVIGVLLVATLFTIHGANITENTEVTPVKVNEDFNITKTYNNKSGSTIIEFTDNSYAVINKDINHYEFYPVELHDYEVQGRDIEQLKDILACYMLAKYNMVETEVNSHELFNHKLFN